MTPFQFNRSEKGIYRTSDGTITIRQIISQRNSGRRTERETLWSVQVLGYELAMAYERLEEAKDAAWEFCLVAIRSRIETL